MKGKNSLRKAGTILYLVLLITGGISSFVTPILINLLLHDVESIQAFVWAQQYAVLIYAIPCIVFGIGALRERKVSARLSLGAAALFVVSTLGFSPLSNMPVSNPAVPLVTLNALRALANIAFVLALTLCVAGNWRKYGFAVVAALTLIAVANGAFTHWVYSAAAENVEDYGARLSLMGLISRAFSLLTGAAQIVLAAGFLSHQKKEAEEHIA